MTDEARVAALWLSAYAALEQRSDGLKESQSVSFGLAELYDLLTPVERETVNVLLSEWLQSSDPKKRYDAMFLARCRQIVQLVPAIELAIANLSHVSGPEARDEIEALAMLRQQLLNVGR